MGREARVRKMRVIKENNSVLFASSTELTEELDLVKRARAIGLIVLDDTSEPRIVSPYEQNR
jgi:ethanolamine utilization microcompartment shell protein EutL